MFDPDPNSGASPDSARLSPLLRVVFYLPAYLLSQLVFSALLLGVWLALRGGAPVETLEPTVPLVVLIGVGYFPFFLVGTWRFVRGVDRRTLGDLGWRLPGAGAGRPLLHVTGSVAAAAALLGLWFALGQFGFDLTFGGFSQLGAGAVPSAGGLALLFAGFGLTAAIEELAFRGYVFHALRERGSWATAAGLQAVLFAALHAGNPGMAPAGLLNTFLLGLALAALVEATGNLLAAIVTHATWNFLVCLGLPISGLPSLGVVEVELAGPSGWTGGTYGPEGSWLLSVMMVGLVLGLARWADRARSARGEAETGVPAVPPQAP